MLKYRIISGLAMGGAFLAATLFMPPVGALLALLALTALGLHEYFAMLDAARIPNFRILGTLGGCALVWAAWYGARCPVGLEADVFALFFCFFAVFVRQLFARQVRRPLETMAGTLMGILYIGFCISFFVRILHIGGELNGRWLLFFAIGVVKISDVGAFLFGTRFGRHKLIERISPAKTWEGTIGGVLTSVVVSIAVIEATGGRLAAGIQLSRLDAVALGVLLSVTGILGDLAESVLKRAAGLKDSSRLIAGMGGVLDVLDSILPAAPVFYFYLRLFGA